jgi:hypothetical protein
MNTGLTGDCRKPFGADRRIAATSNGHVWLTYEEFRWREHQAARPFDWRSFVAMCIHRGWRIDVLVR